MTLDQVDQVALVKSQLREQLREPADLIPPQTSRLPEAAAVFAIPKPIPMAITIRSSKAVKITL